MGKYKLTIEERLEQQKLNIKKLTSILKSLKEIERVGSYCEKDLKNTAEEIRRIREVHKTKIKLYELEEKAS